MSKKIGLILCALILSSLLVGVVSAVEWGSSGDSVANGLDKFADIINPIAKYLLGDVTGVSGISSSELLFAKIMIFILVLSLVWLALSKLDFFEETTWAHWLVSLAVSILAVRFLGPQLITTIILPYSTLGVALAAIMPFVVWFLLVNVGMSGIRYRSVRKIAWVFFGVIFIGLWIARGDVTGSARGIYGWTALIALIMAMLDGTINNFFVQMKIEKAGVRNKTELETDLLRKINLANSDFAAGIITAVERDKRINSYQKTISKLHK